MVVALSVDVKPRVKMTNSVKSPKPDKSVLIVAQELKLARTLAGNNKTLRDRTLKRLKKWFKARESQMPFTEHDFMTIWKGLFYYMWMSDKPLVQEECANNISKLADFENVETSLLFFKCFMKTMINEWFGIDHLRLDKFLMLVRRVLRQTFAVLAKSEWTPENVNLFKEVLEETVLKLGSSVPLSLSMHITEIYLEELSKMSKGDISEDMVLELTRPFAYQLAFTRDSRQSQHVKQHIFRYLMKQSDPGIEYQIRFDAWRQLGFPGGTIDAMEKVELEPEEQNDEDLPEIEENNPLDPRAGKVHVDLPQLKFDSVKFAEMLEELKFRPKTTTKTRRTLTTLSENFRTLATGEYLYGLKKVEFKPKNNGVSTSVKSSLKRLRRFENQILGDSKKAKTAKLKNKKIQEIVKQELKKYANEAPSKTIEDFISKSEGGILQPKTIQNNKKVTGYVTKISTPKVKKPKITKDKNSANNKKQFARSSGMWEVDDLNNSSTSSPSPVIGNWVTEKSDNETPSISTRRSKRRKLNEIEKEVIPSTPKSSLKNKFSTPMVKNPFSTPISSAKKVKIALDLNRSQDHSEYHQSLVSSPGIPYDANRKPTKPLLKTRNSLPGAINPFYKFKK